MEAGLSYNIEHAEICGWLSSVLSSVLGSNVLVWKNICALGIMSNPKMLKNHFFLLA